MTASPIAHAPIESLWPFRGNTEPSRRGRIAHAPDRIALAIPRKHGNPHDPAGSHAPDRIALAIPRKHGNSHDPAGSHAPDQIALAIPRKHGNLTTGLGRSRPDQIALAIPRKHGNPHDPAGSPTPPDRIALAIPRKHGEPHDPDRQRPDGIALAIPRKHGTSRPGPDRTRSPSARIGSGRRRLGLLDQLVLVRVVVDRAGQRLAESREVGRRRGS
jgi:hypothetical protein